MNEEVMTPVLTITDSDALKALRHVVAEKGPDHVYRAPVKGQTSCVYVWEVDGELKPQCIVGCALHYLGVPLEVMAQEGCNEINAWALASKISPQYVIENRAVDIFRAAQLVQDSALKTGCTCSLCTEAAKAANDDKATWGVALLAAEKWAAMYPVKPAPPADPAHPADAAPATEAPATEAAGE
jgi:hypothetical protein